MTVGWGGLGGRGIEQKGKRTHGHGQQCGDCREEEGIRGLNGNGKNTIKIKFKNIHKQDTNFKYLVSLSGLPFHSLIDIF